MGKQTLKYICTCIGIYLLLFVIEIFVLKNLIDFIGSDFKTYLIIYNVFLFAINPIVSWMIVKKLDFHSNDIIE